MNKGITQHQIEKEYGIGRERIRQYRDLVFPNLNDGEVMYFDDKAILKMQIIHFFREMEASPKEIRRVLSNPDCDYDAILDELIHGLKKKMQEYQKLIDSAEGIRAIGANAIMKGTDPVRKSGFSGISDFYKDMTGYSNPIEFVKSIPEEYMNRMIDTLVGIAQIKESDDECEILREVNNYYQVLSEMCESGIYKGLTPIKMIWGTLIGFSMDTTTVSITFNNRFGAETSEFIAGAMGIFVLKRFSQDYPGLFERIDNIDNEKNNVEEIRDVIQEFQNTAEKYIGDDDADYLWLMELYLVLNEASEDVITDEIESYRNKESKGENHGKR